MSEANKFLIIETAVVRKRNKENGLGDYFIVAKTSDGLLYEHSQSPRTIDVAIMWAEMLEGTVMVVKDWISLVKVL